MLSRTPSPVGRREGLADSDEDRGRPSEAEKRDFLRANSRSRVRSRSDHETRCPEIKAGDHLGFGQGRFGRRIRIDEVLSSSQDNTRISATDIHSGKTLRNFNPSGADWFFSLEQETNQTNRRRRRADGHHQRNREDFFKIFKIEKDEFKFFGREPAHITRSHDQQDVEGYSKNRSSRNRRRYQSSEPRCGYSESGGTPHWGYSGNFGGCGRRRSLFGTVCGVVAGFAALGVASWAVWLGAGLITVLTVGAIAAAFS